MNLLSPAQCRAARGLLNWSQPDLSERSDVHVQTISAFEHEKGTPTKRTLKKILHAFEFAGIEFTDNEGLRNQALKTRTYRGQIGFIEFMDLVYETARDKGGEFCTCNVKENHFIDNMPGNKMQEHLDRMAAIKNNFNFRVLVKEGDTNFLGAGYVEYRYIPKTEFKNTPFYVFGDYLAFLLFEGQTTVHLIHNADIAATQRIQFDWAWKAAKPVTKK